MAALNAVGLFVSWVVGEEADEAAENVEDEGEGVAVGASDRLP